MPFPKDLKTKHQKRSFLYQSEQFINISLNSPFLIGNLEHEFIKIYLTILPKIPLVTQPFSDIPTGMYRA